MKTNNWQVENSPIIGAEEKQLKIQLFFDLLILPTKTKPVKLV
ncbi:hypothetical protein [Thalassotalea marina]|nr:hypothetical protein [Thalassotalea marina]